MAWLPWLVVGAMFALSAWAFPRVPAHARLPMQWGLDGKVGWRAPRVIALLFAPTLALAILALTAVVADADPQGGAIALTIAAAFGVAHVVHVVLALRDVAAQSKQPRGRA